jgi:DNA-binding NarL/FixJ family response regulator
MQTPENRRQAVLVVDDVPESLAFLCEALDDAGFTVLVATDGPSALDRLRRVEPDVVLLDASMPGMDGFEVCRRIKADSALSALPVVFMTGLTETEHIIAGFHAGGIDYVTKPVQPEELIVRLRSHSRNARAMRQAREALDIAGHGVVVVDADGGMLWRSRQAEIWLEEFFGAANEKVPDAVSTWLAASPSGEDRLPLVAGHAGQQLVLREIGSVGLGERLLLLNRRQAGSPAMRLQRAALTPRETEVLYWLARGKTNRDIAEICGMKPRTVTKHLEHIFEKLGVETRAAAAVLASAELSDIPVGQSAIGCLHPPRMK